MYRSLSNLVSYRKCASRLCTTASNTNPTELTYFPPQAIVDTLVVGGGVIGCSLALHLAQKRGSGKGITVIEKDPTYTYNSACLSAGGIRQQYSLKTNIEMSLYGLQFLRNLKEEAKTNVEVNDIQFHEHGYLFLASTEDGKQRLVTNLATQKEAGCNTTGVMTQTELKKKHPWMNVDGILAAGYSTEGEGWFDPWALLINMKSKASALGVTFLHGHPISAVRDPISKKVDSVHVSLLQHGVRTKRRLPVCNVVNAAGAFSADVQLMMAAQDPSVFPLPVRPRKRSIFFFRCSAAEGCPEIAPLTVDPTGVYFRSEGAGNNRKFLCGVSPKEDFDFTEDVSTLCADHSLFEEVIWPTLYNRVQAFGELKVRSSWAGLYEYNTCDQNGVVGFHPEIPNLLMLTGFSGHGLQLSPAAGRAGAELLHEGRFSTIDLNIFGFERLVTGEYVHEEGIV